MGSGAHVCKGWQVSPQASTSVPKAGSKGEEAFALHCRLEELKPEREYVFHPTRKWRFDFAWPDIKLAVEIEGRGRHQSFGGFEKDAEKYNAAAKLGWRVMRYTPAMVMRADAISDILEMLHG
jgi:very-short-patch-repair endonuclease